METNAFFAYKFFNDNDVLHDNFREKLALGLLRTGEELPQARGPAEQPQPPANLQQGAHVLARIGLRKQLTCIVCSRVRKQPMKASYYCTDCGVNAIFCSPNTGRDCFAHHILNGIPA